MKLAAILILSGIALACDAQSFEVVSVKLEPKWNMQGMPPIFSKQGGPGTANPTRVTYRHYLMQMLLVEAFDVQQYQIEAPAWITQPNYLDGERYEISAILPQGTTETEYHEMLRKLLIQRFGLELRREKKTEQGFELRTADRGSKLTPELDAPASQDAVGLKYPTGADGFDVLPPGRPGLRVRAEKDRTMHVKFYAQTMEYLAGWIANTQVKRPVTDRTGLTGKYTFLLQYQHAAPGAESPEGVEVGAPTLFGALGSQLGLRLVKAPSEVEKLVIERANRVPSEN